MERFEPCMGKYLATNHMTVVLDACILTVDIAKTKQAG